MSTYSKVRVIVTLSNGFLQFHIVSTHFKIITGHNSRNLSNLICFPSVAYFIKSEPNQKYTVSYSKVQCAICKVDEKTFEKCDAVSACSDFSSNFEF